MALKGQLQHFGLGELFQTLTVNQHTGSLILERGSEKKIIYFSTGSISLLSTGKTIRLGEILRREGKISEEDLRRVSSEQQESGKLLGRLLIERGLITIEDVQVALRKKIEEELYDLFLWEDGSFEFISDYCPPELDDPLQRHTRISIDPKVIIMEGLRQLDEWMIIRTRIPDPRIIVERTMKVLPAEAGLSAREMVIWNLTERTGAVSAVLADSPETRLRTQKILFRFLEEGWLRTLEFQELLAQAREARKSRRNQEALELYRFLCEWNVEDGREPEVLEEAGFFASEQQHKDEAGKLLERALEEHRARGNTCAAWRIGTRIQDLSPPSLQHLRTMWALRGAGGEKEVARLRDLLVDRLLRVREFLEAKAILVDIEEGSEEDAGYWTTRAEVERGLGEDELAIAHLEQASSLYGESRQFEEQIRVNRVILELDPSRESLRGEIEDLQEERQRSEERRRFQVTIVAVAVIAILTLSIWPIRYELRARELYGRALRLQEAHADSTKLREAARIYTEVAETYPLSTVASRSRRASDEAEEQAEEAQRRGLERSKDEQEQLRLAREARQRNAKELLEQVEAYLRLGNQEEARSRFASFLTGPLQELHGFDLQEIRFPLLIDSDPPGARVFVDGSPLEERTPVVHHYPPGHRFTIKLVRPGCVPQEIPFARPEVVTIHASLKRIPLQEGSLPAPTGGHGIAAGPFFLVPCRDGKIYVLPNDAEVGRYARRVLAGGIPGHPSSRMKLIDRTLLTSAPGGLLQRIDIEVWDRTWEHQGSALTTTPPASTPDGRWIASGDEDGRVVLLKGEDGSQIGSLQGEFPIDAIAFRANQLVVADRGRRMMVLSAPGLELLEKSILPARAVAATGDGGLLLENGDLMAPDQTVSLPPPATVVEEEVGMIRYGATKRRWVIRGAASLQTGPVPEPPTCAPLLRDGFVYIGCSDEQLYCLTLKGEIHWSIPTGGVVRQILPGEGGNLLVLLASGKLLLVEGARQ